MRLGLDDARIEEPELMSPEEFTFAAPTKPDHSSDFSLFKALDCSHQTIFTTSFMDAVVGEAGSDSDSRNLLL